MSNNIWVRELMGTHIGYARGFQAEGILGHWKFLLFPSSYVHTLHYQDIHMHHSFENAGTYL